MKELFSLFPPSLSFPPSLPHSVLHSLPYPFCLSPLPSPPLHPCSFQWYFIIYLPFFSYCQQETQERNLTFPTHSSLSSAPLTAVFSVPLFMLYPLLRSSLFFHLSLISLFPESDFYLFFKVWLNIVGRFGMLKLLSQIPDTDL